MRRRSIGLIDTPIRVQGLSAVRRTTTLDCERGHTPAGCAADRAMLRRASWWARPMEDRPDADREAILRLIEDESAAYWNRDYDAWQRCWIQASYIRKAGWWTQGGITWREGFEQIAGRMKKSLSVPPPGRPAGIRRANINIRIDGDLAWMTYDEHWPDAGTDLPGLSRETRILERHAGQWKIAYACYLYR